MRALRLTTLSLCLAASALSAQAASGTINSGTASLQFSELSPFGTTSGNANLYFGTVLNDQLSVYSWAYNQGVGTSNRPFSSLVSPSTSYVGDTATFSWTDNGAGVSGFARFDAVMTIKLVELAPSTGTGSTTVPGAARVDTTLTFTSRPTNAGNVAYTVFNVTDLNIKGTNVNAGPDDVHHVVSTDAAATLVRVTDTTVSNYGEIYAPGATRYQNASFSSTLRTPLGFNSGAGSGSLSNAAGTVQSDFSGDGASAFSWTRTLAPGASMTIQQSFSINAPAVTAVPEPGSYALFTVGLVALGGLARQRRQGAGRAALR